MSTAEVRLKLSSVAFAGGIPASFIENIQKHFDVKRVVHSGIRQTHLEWNTDCAAIETYFDTVNKDKILHDTASDFLFYFFQGNQIAN